MPKAFLIKRNIDNGKDEDKAIDFHSEFNTVNEYNEKELVTKTKHETNTDHWRNSSSKRESIEKNTWDFQNISYNQKGHDNRAWSTFQQTIGWHAMQRPQFKSSQNIAVPKRKLKESDTNVDFIHNRFTDLFSHYMKFQNEFFLNRDITRLTNPVRRENKPDAMPSQINKYNNSEMIPSPVGSTTSTISNSEEFYKDERILNTEKPSKRYHCKVCSKSFDRSSSLSNHRLIHNNTKSYKCKQCSMKFLRKSDLAKHTITHTGSKPYECSICGKRFSQSSNMLTHQRRHSGIRPYSCLYCGKSFYRKVDVRRHTVIHKS